MNQTESTTCDVHDRTACRRGNDSRLHSEIIAQHFDGEAEAWGHSYDNDLTDHSSLLHRPFKRLHLTSTVHKLQRYIISLDIIHRVNYVQVFTRSLQRRDRSADCRPQYGIQPVRKCIILAFTCRCVRFCLKNAHLYIYMEMLHIETAFEWTLWELALKTQCCPTVVGWSITTRRLHLTVQSLLFPFAQQFAQTNTDTHTRATRQRKLYLVRHRPTFNL